jgi:hypothetical protein
LSEILPSCFTAKTANLRKCHARLTREYTDGGANICAENEFGTADRSVRQNFITTAFFILRVAIHSAVHVSMGEADEIATQKVAAFALEFPTNREEL